MAINETGGFGVDLESRMNRRAKQGYEVPNAHAHPGAHTDTRTDTAAYIYDYEAPEENKTTRMFLLVRPSVAEKIRTAAKRQKMSANEFIHKLMEQYIEDNNL